MDKSNHREYQYWEEMTKEKGADKDTASIRALVNSSKSKTLRGGKIYYFVKTS